MGPPDILINPQCNQKVSHVAGQRTSSHVISPQWALSVKVTHTGVACYVAGYANTHAASKGFVSLLGLFLSICHESKQVLISCDILVYLNVLFLENEQQVAPKQIRQHGLTTKEILSVDTSNRDAAGVPSHVLLV